MPRKLIGRFGKLTRRKGSGKTLAYSLPILSHVLASARPRSTTKRPLSALVLCPTRELAIQVVESLKRLLQHIEAKNEDDDAKEKEVDGQSKSAAKGSAKGKKTANSNNGPPLVSIGSVVGGLSAQKQKRIVDRGCDILVATPGRLWDLIKSVGSTHFVSSHARTQR